MDELLSTQDVARMAGVGPTAVKRWADALILPSLRTVGGHRRFRRSEVERFLRERGGVGLEAGSWADLLLHAEDARVLAGELLLERARAGSWWRVADTLGAALEVVGERWAEGRVSVGEEHLASERLSRALARTVEDMPMARTAPRCLLLTAQGDDHTLGLSLAELVLREAGWCTLWAGRATPLADLDRLLSASAIALVGVSGSCYSSDPGALARFATAVCETCAAGGVAVALGGAAAWPDACAGGHRFRDMEAFGPFAVAELTRAMTE